MATQSPEQRELALIGKLEMRIALADSDAKLEATLKTYLAPLLLKMASEHVSVRNKVVSVCQHISTRTKPQSIQLPVAALVKQFKEQENSFVRHFDFVYIQQGVGRLTAAEKATLFPLVIDGISNSGRHGPQIFNLLLRLLESFVLPLRGSKEDHDMRTALGVSEQDTSYLATWLGKFVLFVPQKGSSQTCPGLTAEDYAFLSLSGKEALFSPAAGGINLLQAKTLAARLLASGLFTDRERVLPALFAAADVASSIRDVGDDMMKRVLPATDLEDEMLVKRLFDLYFGKDGAPRVPAPLRMKILSLLSKSPKSTTFANHIMKVVNDGISNTSMDNEDVVMSNGPVSNSNTGREATKLRTAIFAYINFVARNGSADTLHAIAQPVVGKLRDYVENQGWPNPGLNEDLISRAYAFEVIGLLARAGPKSLLVEAEHPSLDLLRWLLDSLARDSSGNSITVSIEESLSTVLSALSRFDLSAEERDVLEGILTEQMMQSADLEGHKRVRSTAYVAIRFTNRCLPYASVKARWINVMGIGATNDRAEVREESERGLSPYWHQMLNGTIGLISSSQTTLPKFEQLVEQFFPGRATDMDLEPMSVARQTRRLHPSSFQAMTSFVRRILFYEALTLADVHMNIDSEWERRVDTAIDSDEKARDIVADYIEHLWHSSPQKVKTILSALFVSLTELASGSGDQLIQFLALSPNELVLVLVDYAKALVPVIQANDLPRRVAAAHTYGILASQLATGHTQQIDEQIKQFFTIASGWQHAVGSASNQVHGAIVVLGYLFSRMHRRGRKVTQMEVFVPFIQTLMDIVTQSRDATTREATYSAIGQLAMLDTVSPSMIEQFVTINALIDKLYDTAKLGNEPAILCLGQLSMILPEQSISDIGSLQYLEDKLHKLHEIRQAEVHFTVGEAYSYVASGWTSGALATKLDIGGDKPRGPDRSATLTRIFDQVLADCTTTKPALKQAAVMWLLCLVQFCGGKPEVQTYLPKCQAAFRRCLADPRSLVQESASRGLGLVYEKGSRQLKDDLVKDLVNSFSSDRQSQLAGSVSADTQLFEPGQLPTGDGSVSSYADIMSLASEVGGDSSLVYKFMSMASSNAIWSTRAAFGKFGLSNVLSDSTVDGYLSKTPKLYPKLFRYRFDPKSGASMEVIWKALVKDSAAIVDLHFAAIMDDLLTSIVGREWRVRQASCAAIADLVQGRPIEKYEQYLESIWTQCFRVLDDIKETVRAAAASLARTLTGVLTRTLEADHSATKNAAAMLKHVLPFLLSPSGLESGAKEVQAFSVHTLLEIIKKSNGKTLRPFIPQLVERLLGLLSSLEPEAVNYVHLNAAKYNLTEQKIDDMRLSSIRSSPLMEAIERCLDLLDDETMQTLQPRFEGAMKSAVGLPSKVGASRVLVSLSTRRSAVFRPFADATLKLIEKVILDRNETVSSSYAVAAGYVARLASDKQILRLLTFARGLYFDSEGDRESSIPRRSVTAGEILFAITKHANDRFNSLAASALPFAFVGRHDSHDAVKEQFENTWNESVGGTRAVALYLEEITALCAKYLDSPQWTLKHTAARTVAACVLSLTSIEKELSANVAATLWPVLDKALGGKTWDGKEELLPAFAKFVEAGKDYYSNQPTVAGSILKIAVREAKRQNARYQQYAIKCLGQVARARVDVDLSETVFDIALPLIVDADDNGEMDVDKNPNSDEDKFKDETVAASIEAMFASINPSAAPGSRMTLQLSRAVRQVTALRFPAPGVWRSTYVGLEELFVRLVPHEDSGQVVLEAWADVRPMFLLEPGTEALRLLRASVLVSAAALSPRLKAELQIDVLHLHAAEKSRAVQGRLDMAK
nr:proteasome component ecm29 [Quercus suber]